MNRRNTEGYVLAYLLIVITVMGVIAATLMTSTLQVVQAQEKSLVYMKDKYEAMGELERFVSELEISHPTSDITSAVFRNDATSAYNDAIYQFSTYLDALDPSSLTKTYEVSYNEDDGIFSLLIEISNRSVSLTSNITCSPELTEHRDPVTIPDRDETPDIDESDSYTNYSYTISGIRDLTFSSYKITSAGGGT